MSSDLHLWDKQHLWHPFTQHQGAAAPLLVTHAKGSRLYLSDGRSLIDGISSWWVNLHGHCHPHLAAAVTSQMQKLDHVLFAEITHEEAINFTQALLPLVPRGLSRVFFSDNGSTAVEVALKMAVQYWYNRGTPKRKFIAFNGGYHGDTFGAMAASARSPFTAAFTPLFFEVYFIDPPCGEAGTKDALAQLARLLEQHDDIAAFIYEPLVQGAAGMVMHDAAGLNQLLAYATAAGLLCIADEVMTGFGRTGGLFASEAMATAPDILCLGKGITGGVVPLSVTLAREEIFAAFLGERKEKAFLHGHSYTANSIGCRLGLASLELLLQESCSVARREIEASHRRFKAELANSPEAGCFREVRVQGTILACELASSETTGYFNSLRDTMAAYFISEGVLLRPLGNVVYVLPPYCVSAEELDTAYRAIRGFVRRYLV
jgi:adenosylmethionine-8-amino-7-oxononanoate aminotransferase